MTVKAKLWGTRGSLPVSGPQVLEFGGSTSCYEFRSQVGNVILDAGSGIVQLGRELVTSDRGPFELNVLFSHAHLDHFMGLPFFLPLFDPRFSVRFWAPEGVLESPFNTVLHQFLDSAFCPVKTAFFQADVSFVEVPTDSPFEVANGLRAQATALSHPGGSVGYRLEADGKSLLYSGDFEHGDPESDQRLIALCEGVDLAILDCTYTPQNYERHLGFGHAHWQAAGELAKGARRWIGVHHSHHASDDELRGIEAQIKAKFANAWLGRDGEEITL